MTTQPTLAATIDRDIYHITKMCRPATVYLVTFLIAAGQTPAQIEQTFVAKLGVSQTTRNIRHCAEYIAAQQGK
jgi:hypothetical protein